MGQGRTLEMAKTAFEKAVEKQTKEAQKAAREAKIRERASAIVNAQPLVSGFQIMDQDAEVVLKAILDAYDGNENNYIGGFDRDLLPRYLQDSVGVEYEKLQMYGMLSSVLQYLSGANLTITERAKSYFDDKETALTRAEEDKKEQRRIAEIEASTHIHKQYDVFISHASADKEDYVDLLVMAVKRLGINVFYDTDVLSWGDKWKEVIIQGTADSEFAIIVISKNFFGREWTEKELTEFLSQQNESGQKIVLPLLLGISMDDLKEHYPELGDIQCISSEKFGKEEIVILLAKELIKRYK